MGEQGRVHLGRCGMPRCGGAGGSSTGQIINPGDHRDEVAEATPNLTLALLVLALAVALPCVPLIVGMTAQLGIPGSVAPWLNLFGTGAIVVKWASIALGIGRYSTAW